MRINISLKIKNKEKHRKPGLCQRKIKLFLSGPNKFEFAVFSSYTQDSFPIFLLFVRDALQYHGQK